MGPISYLYASVTWLCAPLWCCHPVNTNGLWWHQDSVMRTGTQQGMLGAGMVALCGGGAVISTPLLLWTLSLPKTPSICRISRAGQVQAMHFPAISRCASACPASSSNSPTCQQLGLRPLQEGKKTDHIYFLWNSKLVQHLTNCLDTATLYLR